MLDNLRIKNVALIDEIEIVFGKGLNILSGETGAGKSIIIDSINFVLGGRANKDFIRNGEFSAFVEALFYINNIETQNLLKESGIDIDEDNAVLIYRSFNEAGKSVCRINGRTVTLGMLKELTPYFIDLHGQHEHQSLLNQSRHIQLIDKFCPEKLVQLKTQITENYKNYKEIAKQINSISGDEKERLATIDLLAFQINEIEKAKLKRGEDEELLKKRAVINSSEKLIVSSVNALELLYGLNTDEMSASDKISKALGYIESIAELDSSKKYMAETLSGLLSNLNDISIELRDYYDNLEHDPSEIERIESRLDLIYGLKRKYGLTTNEILDYYEKIKERFDFINNSEEQINRLNARKNEIEKEILSLCKDMSAMRKIAAKNIQEQIIATLQELGMKNVQFDIQFEKKDTFSLNGFDKTEFYISPNAGEALKPLAKTASGGEMSRVMLALKTVLADVDNIETFIFDEIDTGVSGRTAQKVAEKLSLLSIKNQILCITHLPQIAAMADNHYLIEKKSVSSRTTTNIYELDNKQMIEELARLTGGAQITDVTLKAAEEMKQMAMKIKNSFN